MNPVDLHHFIKEAFHWDGDCWAAFGTGALLALLAVWLVRRWLPARSERGFNGWLRKDIEELKKERTELLRAQREAHHQLSDLRVANAQLQKDNATYTEKFSQYDSAWNKVRGRINAYLTLKEQLQQKEQELTRAQANQERLYTEIDELTGECEKWKEQLTVLDAARDQNEEAYRQAEASLQVLRAQLQATTAQIDAIACSDNRVWAQLPAERPQPRTPGGRRAPIVAVLNLKGGVGKTTLTANLGATLGKQGRKVLLVDLDYQASLSNLCLSGEKFRQVRDHRHFVQQLLRPDEARGATVKELLTPLEGARGSLLAADEDLQDVEAQLLARWLAKPDEGDVRFLLRQALQAPPVQEAFDIVLLDCPPRLTTACVNALACCDYALVPVLLDETSAAAVPRLLRWLDQLRPALCPDVKVLGVVANRVTLRNGSLTKGQQAVWNELPARCRDVWGEPVAFFRAHVKQDSAFAEAADRHRFAADDPELRSFFEDLANELKERIKRHESGRAAAVPPQPERAAEHVGCRQGRR